MVSRLARRTGSRGAVSTTIGPEIAPEGMAVIRSYVGIAPKEKTLAEAAAMRAALQPGFEGVPYSRWAEEVAHHYVETPDGLALRYDPRLSGSRCWRASRPSPASPTSGRVRRRAGKACRGC